MRIEIVIGPHLRGAPFVDEPLWFLATTDLSKDLTDDRLPGRGPTLGAGAGGAWI